MLPDRTRRQARPLARLVRQGHVVDQAARLADTVHHIVAGVDAQRAGDAFHLLPVADVDAHRAHVYAGHAVDAVALGGDRISASVQRLRQIRDMRVGHIGVGTLALAARLSPPVAVGDGQGVGVHHRGLNARPGAHVDADLFAHKAAKDKGRRGQNGDGNIGGGVRGAVQQVSQQGGGVGEIEHPGTARGQRDGKPDRPFHAAQPRLVRGPFGIVEPHTGVAVAFNPAFHKDEQVSPDGLRTGIAAPNASQRRGEQKQPKARHDQQTRDEVKFVGPNLDPEKVKAAVGQINQHRLVRHAGAAVPAQPWCEGVNAQRQRQDPPFQAAKGTTDAAGKDRLARGVEGRSGHD